MHEVLQKIEEHCVIPVLTVESPDTVVGLADALIAGGLPVAEITFRTAAAAEALRTLRRERPQVLLGAGTVLSPKNAELAKEAGAQFLVAPGLNPAVVARARELGLPMVPGIITPTELEEALSLGCKFLKVFPVEMMGGTRLLQVLSGPYAHMEVRFLATGGVTAATLASYLEIDTVAAVGGTWIAKKEDISGKRWDDILGRCREAVAIVRRTRPR